MQINNGSSNIWSEPWCEGWESIHSHLNLSHNEPSLPNQVSELWNNRLLCWDATKVESIFHQPASQKILATQRVLSSDPDKLCWKLSSQGDCTTKQAYKCISSVATHTLPSHGLRHISSQAMLILRRTWNHKNIPPRIKTFVWRLIRHALATGQRAGNLSHRIDKYCKICDTLLQQVFTRLWYIWRARNDLRFNNNKWSVHRVCQEVEGDIASSFLSISPSTSVNTQNSTNQVPTSLGNQRINQIALLQNSCRSLLTQPTFSQGVLVPGQDTLFISPVYMQMSTQGFTDVAVDPDAQGGGGTPGQQVWELSWTCVVLLWVAAFRSRQEQWSVQSFWGSCLLSLLG
ncbi:unnamed protein product [Urochloa humidicola]